MINLSSIVGSHPVAGALLYVSTKGAIDTLTKGLALELASRKSGCGSSDAFLNAARQLHCRHTMSAAALRSESYSEGAVYRLACGAAIRDAAIANAASTSTDSGSVQR